MLAAPIPRIAFVFGREADPNRKGRLIRLLHRTRCFVIMGIFGPIERYTATKRKRMKLNT